MPRSTSPVLYRQIGSQITDYRKKCRPPLSQQGLATAAGVSRASIVNIERGRHRVQLHVLYDIARALGVSPFELLPRPAKAETARILPKEIRTKLNPEEAASVGRLLEDTQGDSHA